MAMKRANGSGTVYKMKHKPLRKPYRAVVTLGYDAKGKALRKTIGYYAKSKEAWDALSEYGIYPEKFETKKVLFSECWRWMLADKERKGIDTKKGSYSTAAAKLGTIWNKPIQEIRLVHLQAIIDANSHLSRSSIAIILKGLNGAFESAIKNDIIVKNYAALLDLKPAEKSDIHKPYTEEEIQKIWQHADTNIGKLILMYIYSGMRPVELLSIKLENVHLEERYIIGGVKTKAGKDRIIPIADCVMPFYREIHAQALIAKSDTLIPHGYISKYLGGPIKRFCKEIGIQEHLPHDTRHTFITLASNYGMDRYILKSIVGHTQSKDVTADIYIHKTIKQYIDEVNKIPASFG